MFAKDHDIPLWSVFPTWVPQKSTKIHKALYTWELYDGIVNFQYVQDLLFLRIIISKQSVLSNYYNTS